MVETPNAVEVRGLSKQFVIRRDRSLKERLVQRRTSLAHKEVFWALRDVDVDVRAGDSMGIIGANGSGKSTLLKCMTGVIQPDAGTVGIRGRIAALLELGAGFHPDLTGAENIFLNAAIMGRTRAETQRDFDAIVAFSGIGDFINSQVKFYSSGMYVRLAFSVAIHVDPDMLLVDEVLAVGDEPFQRKCMERIHEFQRDGRTIVFVSHSAEQVLDLCNRAVVLDHGRVVTIDEPEAAFKVLREGYNETMQAQSAAEQADGHSPRLSGIAVGQPGTGSTEQQVSIAPGGAVVVSGQVLAGPGGATTSTLGVSIETSGGVTIYSVESSALGLAFDGSRDHDFELLFPDLWLASGEYALSLRLIGSDGGQLDSVPRCATITVDGGTGSAGFLHVRPQLLVGD